MIRNKIYSVLKQHLDHFLFGFDKNQMELSLLTGRVDLKNVIIRPEAVNEIFEAQ